MPAGICRWRVGGSPWLLRCDADAVLAHARRDEVRELRSIEDISVGERHRAFHAALELAHVEWPVVV